MFRIIKTLVDAIPKTLVQGHFTSLAIKDKFVSALHKATAGKNVLFLCVGTSALAGDALGPLVGSRLQELGYPVLGTLNLEANAANLTEIVPKITTSKEILVVAIDAVVGHNLIGTISFIKGSLKPGQGVGKSLPVIGNYYISGLTAAADGNIYTNLKRADFLYVVEMADFIVGAIKVAVKPEFDKIAISNLKIHL